MLVGLQSGSGNYGADGRLRHCQASSWAMNTVGAAVYYYYYYYYYYWSAIEYRWGARFSARIQTGSGAHPASYTMGTGSFPGVKRPGRGVDHPPHLEPRLKEE